MRAEAALLLGAFLLIVAVPALHAAPALFPIRPGAPLGSWPLPTGPLAGCTLDFVYRNAAGAWFIGTAAHCVNLGDRAANVQAGTFGTVVVDDDYEAPGGIDVALIRIDAAKIGLVSPAVRGWGGPTGVASPASAISGDLLDLHGYTLGGGYGHPVSTPQIATGQNRLGVLAKIVDGEVFYSAPYAFGDSGSPILLHKDGRAIGLASSAHLYAQTQDPPGVVRGPTVAAGLARMASLGFSLTLQTAPHNQIPG